MVISRLLLPEVTGKRFGTIFERELIPLRNNVAHALFEAAELSLSGDNYMSYETINKFLPITKCMVRRMLKIAATALAAFGATTVCQKQCRRAPMPTCRGHRTGEIAPYLPR
jgi:hypothetical protein